MRRIVLAMAMAWGLCAPVAAQGPPAAVLGIPGWTLQEALQAALSRHPSVAAARQRLEGARAWSRGAGAQPNPELRVSATLGEPGEDANALVQRLEMAGQGGLRAGAARAEAEAARCALEAARREVARLATAAYYASWQAEALLGVARERLQLSQGLERTSQARLEAGEISENAHLRTRLEVARAEADLASAEGQAGAERARLNLLLGRGPEDPFAFPVSPEAPVPRAPEGPGALAPTAELRERARSMPELKALRSSARAAELEAELAGRERSPDLELSAYRSRVSGSGVAQGLQLSLLVPLWDNGQVSAREERLRAEAAAREGEAAARTLDLEMQLVASFRLLEAARARREILETQLARSRRLAEMARVGYEAGLLTLPEVLDAQGSFRLALGDFVNAEAAVRLAEADLYWLSGGDLPDGPALSGGTNR